MINAIQLSVTLLHCGNTSPANAADRKLKNMFFMPMGLFALASELKRAGVDVELVHSDLTSSGACAVDFLGIDALGLDCHWSNQSLMVLQTATLAKRSNPRLFIFLGGFTASLFAGEILRHYPCIDAVIRGDAEVAITSLCAELARSKVSRADPDLHSVPNLVWRDVSQVHANMASTCMTADDLDRLEFAEVGLLRNWEEYRDRCQFWSLFPEIRSQRLFLLEVGRGCRYQCSFCGGNAKAQAHISRRTGMVLRSVDSVLQTIRQACLHGYSMFYTCYDEPGVSDRWFIELFERLLRLDLPVSFGYGSWKLPSRDLIRTMSECCQQVIIEISPESATEELRRRNKDERLYYSNHELEECLDYIGTRRNCKAQVYFGYFLPFDTAASVEETVRYVGDLDRRYGAIAEMRYLRLSTDPGSLLFVDPERFGVEIEIRTFADYICALKRNYIAGTGGLECWPKAMGLLEADRLDKMITGEDLVLAGRLNVHSPLTKILADRAGRRILSPYLSKRVWNAIRQAGGMNVLQLATMYPGEMTRERVMCISKGLAGVSVTGETND